MHKRAILCGTFFFNLGAHLRVWSACFISACDRVALLACATLEGYHPLITWEWKRNGFVTDGEVYPIVYVEQPGTYSCTITRAGTSETLSYSFDVQGILYEWRVS